MRPLEGRMINRFAQKYKNKIIIKIFVERIMSWGSWSIFMEESPHFNINFLSKDFFTYEMKRNKLPFTFWIGKRKIQYEII